MCKSFFLSGKTFKIILNILIVFPGEKYAILSLTNIFCTIFMNFTPLKIFKKGNSANLKLVNLINFISNFVLYMYYL